jgi:predicted transposase YbfD/YdcC
MEKASDILSYFASMQDPRVERTRHHLLEDIIFITIAGVICTAETWNDIEDFGNAKYTWLKTFLLLPNGIPSHDTFNRFFAALDSRAFEKCFVDWVNSVAKITHGEVVSIDGKTIRGSRGKGAKSAIHMVSAWANINQLVLGQYKVDQKSNEKTAIPALLEVLALKGCIITIDAMGCQTNIAQAILEKGADYILAVKDNQQELHQNIQDSFRFIKPTLSHQFIDADHGRVETRTCTVLDDLSMIEQADKWNGLQSIVKIESERYIKSTGNTENETRYYITSLKADAEKTGKSIRSHWGVENSLHWTLDVAFGEDHSRKRAGNAAENYSIVLRIALNLIKNEKSSNRGIKGKRLKAGWDNDYLLLILKN